MIREIQSAKFDQTVVTTTARKDRDALSVVLRSGLYFRTGDRGLTFIIPTSEANPGSGLDPESRTVNVAFATFMDIIDVIDGGFKPIIPDAGETLQLASCLAIDLYEAGLLVEIEPGVYGTPDSGSLLNSALALMSRHRRKS